MPQQTEYIQQQPVVYQQPLHNLQVVNYSKEELLSQGDLIEEREITREYAMECGNLIEGEAVFVNQVVEPAPVTPCEQLSIRFGDPRRQAQGRQCCSSRRPSDQKHLMSRAAPQGLSRERMKIISVSQGWPRRRRSSFRLISVRIWSFMIHSS